MISSASMILKGLLSLSTFQFLVEMKNAVDTPVISVSGSALLSDIYNIRFWYINETALDGP